MKELAENLRAVEQQIAKEKGPFLLFALFLREDAPGLWDLLVSAPWIEASKGRWNNQIQKLPLFYKHMEDDAEADRERRNKAVRFLFQLHLSRMGDVQVDGFLKQNNLDLILRTKTPVSSGMQETMKRLYTQTVEKSNLTGELGFQFKPDQWVEFR